MSDLFWGVPCQLSLLESLASFLLKSPKSSLLALEESSVKLVLGSPFSPFSSGVLCQLSLLESLASGFLLKSLLPAFS